VRPAVRGEGVAYSFVPPVHTKESHRDPNKRSGKREFFMPEKGRKIKFALGSAKTAQKICECAENDVPLHKIFVIVQ
jgi:hypothetical protein